MSWRGAFVPRRRVLCAEDADRLRNLLGTRVAREYPHEARRLAEVLERATVVTRARVPPDVVTMNSRVVYMTSNGRRVEATLVYPWDVPRSLSGVHVLSDVGLSTLGSRVGSRIDTTTRTGERIEWAIVRLLYQPEHSGEIHL